MILSQERLLSIASICSICEHGFPTEAIGSGFTARAQRALPILLFSTSRNHGCVRGTARTVFAAGSIFQPVTGGELDLHAAVARYGPVAGYSILVSKYGTPQVLLCCGKDMQEISSLQGGWSHECLRQAHLGFVDTVKVVLVRFQSQLLSDLADVLGCG